MAQRSSFRAKALKKTPPRTILLPDRSQERVEEREAERPAPLLEPRLSLRKRIAVLVAAVAVPAMAAPGDFGAEPASAPGEVATLEAAFAGEPAMPFERPGMSFPGSAFYYLADPPAEALVALPDIDPLGDTGEGREVGELIDAGPAAAAFALGGTGISKARAQQCLAQAVWYEAASESEGGQRAVAQVVLNRVAHPSWPGSVCGVVYQGSARSTGCQFSFTCDGSLRRKASGSSWQRAQQVAASALAGDVYAPVGHATHYHTLWVNPYWAGSLEHVGTIGAHKFYRNRGAAGRKSAFTGGYSASEPSVGGRATAAITPPPSINPTPASVVTSARENETSATETETVSLQPETIASTTDPGLETAGRVKAPYANAGQWKTDPKELDLTVDALPPGSSQ